MILNNWTLLTYVGLFIFFVFLSVAHSAPLRSFPNSQVTPGQVRTWNVERICATTWSKIPRKIYKSHKKRVSKFYGIDFETQRSLYEYDHLVPRCLGGSDTVANLFPLHRGGKWNAYDKNRLEVRACRLVCKGVLDLEKTQSAFSTNWVNLYKKVFPLRGLLFILR
jgi:hypothetical protein